MNETYQSINRTAIEARARQLRAEAARDGMLAIRRAVSNAFASLSLKASKAA